MTLRNESITIDSSTGEKLLDTQLSMEANRLSSVFKIQPGLKIIIAPDRWATNALAIDETYIERTKGTVMLGLDLIIRELRETNHRGWGGITVAGFMAHEFAHIYQYSGEYYRRLQQLSNTARPIELHADFLAGYHLGLKRRSGAPMDIGAFIDGAYLSGDENLTAKDHHGRPEERRRAVREGYRAGVEGHQPISVVAEIGYKKVKDIMQMIF